LVATMLSFIFDMECDVYVQIQREILHE
jgi:hypothetical protein